MSDPKILSDSDKQKDILSLSQKIGLSDCAQATIVGDEFSMQCDNAEFKGNFSKYIGIPSTSTGNIDTDTGSSKYIGIPSTSTGNIDTDTGRRTSEVSYRWAEKQGTCSQKCGGKRIDDHICQNEEGSRVHPSFCTAVKPDTKTVLCDPCDDTWTKLKNQEWFWPAVIALCAWVGLIVLAWVISRLFF